MNDENEKFIHRLLSETEGNGMEGWNRFRGAFFLLVRGRKLRHFSFGYILKKKINTHIPQNCIKRS